MAATYHSKLIPYSNSFETQLNEALSNIPQGLALIRSEALPVGYLLIYQVREETAVQAHGIPALPNQSTLSGMDTDALKNTLMLLCLHAVHDAPYAAAYVHNTDPAVRRKMLQLMPQLTAAHDAHCGDPTCVVTKGMQVVNGIFRKYSVDVS